MAFKWANPGCCCSTGPPAVCGQLCGTVSGPCGPVSGATVTLSLGGSTVGTAVTDASGHYCIPFYVSGSYTVTVAPPTGGYNTPSPVTASITCGNRTLNLTVTMATGYACATSCCPQPGNPPYPAVTWPDTFTGTDPQGSFSMTRDLAFAMRWKTTAPVLRHSCSRSHMNADGSCTALGAGSVYMQYYFECNDHGTGSSSWTLYPQIYYATCGGVTFSALNDSPSSGNLGQLVNSSFGGPGLSEVATSCPPSFAWSATQDAVCGSPFDNVYNNRCDCFGATNIPVTLSVSGGGGPGGAAAPSPIAMPGMMRQAANFAGAARRHLAAGMPQTPADRLAARLAVCEACPRLSPERACTACGCPVDKKAAWEKEACPEGRWDA